MSDDAADQNPRRKPGHGWGAFGPLSEHVPSGMRGLSDYLADVRQTPVRDARRRGLANTKPYAVSLHTTRAKTKESLQ